MKDSVGMTVSVRVLRKKKLGQLCSLGNSKVGWKGGQQGRERQGMEKHEGVFQFKGKNHSVVQG